MLRWVIAAVAVLALVGCAWAAWQVWQVNRDLDQATAHAEAFRTALAADDQQAVDRELSGLQESSEAAADRTSGITWSVMTAVPFVGDDARGVRIASEVLQDLSVDGLEPFVRVSDHLGRIEPSEGTVPIEAIERLRAPVGTAREAVVAADRRLDDVDPAGFIGRLEDRYRQLQTTVADAADAMTSAEVAIEVLPQMLGQDGPRDYLLLFQNNAEIRATGGMPGSWAQIHAEDGRLEMVQQGTALDFPRTDEPVVDLSDAELDVYGEELGTYFQDPGFTPDFQRAAEIWRGHWDRKFPDTPIDGVIAIDPVGMSYLVEGTGPIQAGSTTLTADNLVEELLSRPYLELDEPAQNALFQETARAIFDALTHDLASPVAFVEGLRRAAAEGRFLVAPFDAEDAKALEASAVLGELPTKATTTPYVDIGLNDATGSKMSYYLRYWAEIDATACRAGRQRLEGTMTLNQTIPPQQAAELPESVTGGGNYGVDPGTQLVAVRIYGPVGGAIDSVRIDGADVPFEQTDLDGRPVTTLAISLSTRDDVVVNWSMDAGDGQTGEVRLHMTPGAQPGGNRERFPSAC